VPRVLIAGVMPFAGKVVRKVDEADSGGEIDADAHEIRIREDDVDRMRYYLLHEIIHGNVDAQDLARYLGKHEEHFVSLLAQGLLGTFKKTTWRRKGKLLLPRF